MKPPMLAADHIRELIRGWTTVERVLRPTMRAVPSNERPSKSYPWWEPTGHVEWVLHSVTHPALLDQIEETITGASQLDDEDAGRTTFASKPAARIDALDVLARIDAESGKLAATLNIDLMPLRERLSAISGKLGPVTNRAVKSWWVAARIATQWDQPAFKPKGAPCPVDTCEQFGTLRVRLQECIATCVGCGAYWDGQTGVENLGRYVAWCTDHELSKPRHWLIDDLTELVECVECLPVRDAMTERAMTRHQQTQHDGRMNA